MSRRNEVTLLGDPAVKRVLPQEVDLAAHPPNQHPLDPFSGRLITRLADDRPYLAIADTHVLLGCDLLWDILANRALFDEWCQLIPPVTQLDVRASFSLAPGVATFGQLAGVPSNKPTRTNPAIICKDWTMRLLIPNDRPIGYKIGKFRPSLNVMEASLI